MIGLSRERNGQRHGVRYESQWFGLIFPRIHAFLPTGTILEIAPGFGRWTTFLTKHCDHLVLVDLSSKCIESCKQRFAYASHLSYHINDGRSLDMIENRSINFVFSFDSLVHAEADVLESYLDQLSNKLKPHGVGLIHHSNLLQYREVLSIVDSIPEEFQEAIIATQLMAPRHWQLPAYQLVCLKNYVTKPPCNA